MGCLPWGPLELLLLPLSLPCQYWTDTVYYSPSLHSRNLSVLAPGSNLPAASFRHGAYLSAKPKPSWLLCTCRVAVAESGLPSRKQFLSGLL